jgi:hypothetical protein
VEKRIEQGKSLDHQAEAFERMVLPADKVGGR